MVLSDSDSDDDSSVSSDDSGPATKVDVSQFVNRKKVSLNDYDAFKGADEDDEVADKMKSILQLREALGMDKDAAWLAKQQAKEEAKKRLAAMTQEERMEHDKASSMDMMAKIRAKQEELAKKKAEEANQGADAEGEEAKKKKDKKKKSKK
jgi:hypothetical protein